MPKREDQKAPGASRLTTLTNKRNLGAEVEGLDPPEVEAGDHLIKHLFTVGPSSAGEVLTFSEIAAWTTLTGVVVTAWEAETLRAMSAAYLGELDAAKEPGRAAPKDEATG